MVISRFREQYVDALSVYLREQEVAGLDIVTDGDCRFDQDVGGQSWTSYPPHHMSGFDATHPKLAKVGAGGIAFPRGHILHDYLEARVMPKIVGPARPRRDAVRRDLEGGAAPDAAKPVKFGTVTPELVAFAVQDEHYKSLPDRIMAMSDAFNEELHDLADAGCPVIQMEEPQIHLLAARGYVDPVINPEFMLKVFNNTVKGLRAKTEVWCHTCWGNPSQQRMFGSIQSYKPALELLNQVDADVITFEMASSHCAELEDVGQAITTMKVGIGVIDHHTLQVESPEEVAAIVRRALKVIPAERLMLSSDCGMGREGMSRRHAFYKMVALVQGVNVVKKELGLPVTPSQAADPKFSLMRIEPDDHAAMVGLGWWGKTLVESVQGISPDLHFVAGVARTPRRRAHGVRRRAAASRSPTATSRLLADPQVEAVVLATPHSLHARRSSRRRGRQARLLREAVRADEGGRRSGRRRDAGGRRHARAGLQPALSSRDDEAARSRSARATSGRSCTSKRR